MSVLICPTTYRGCGNVGKGEEWKTMHGGDIVICPVCFEDHARQLTNENFERLVDDNDRAQAEALLREYNASKEAAMVRALSSAEPGQVL